MKSFEYAAPQTLKEATALLHSGSQARQQVKILAGGTDLVTSLKQGLAQPDRVVSLRNIKELKGIKSDRKSVRIGAMTTLAELANDKTIRKNYPALITATEGVGSSQIMAVGTVGGDLCQWPRCWYFRNGFGLFARQQGVLGVGEERSRVREGDNRYHAIFSTDGDALFVNASSLAPALIALGASITVVGPSGKPREIEAAKFFAVPLANPTVGADVVTGLQPAEILTEIRVPIQGLKNATYEVRHRHGLDWPYVTVSVAFQLENGKVKDPRVVLGHVASIPWRAPTAANALLGEKVNESIAAKCGDAAAQGAKPLSGNAYKVQLVKVAVKRAVLAAAAA